MSIYATVSGRLGRDPESRTVGNGNTVCSFSVATNYGYGDRQTTTWVRVSVWGKQGENAQRFLAKGREVVAFGELHTREHDGKTYVELDCRGFDLVGGKGDNNHPDVQRNSGGRGNASGAGGASYKDEEIPF